MIPSRSGVKEVVLLERRVDDAEHILVVDGCPSPGPEPSPIGPRIARPHSSE